MLLARDAGRDADSRGVLLPKSNMLRRAVNGKEPFVTGAVRGLRMLLREPMSRCELTKRRAWESEKVPWSAGGDVAVGLRRRWAMSRSRWRAEVLPPREEVRRPLRMAAPIWRAVLLLEKDLSTSLLDE